MTQKKLTDKQQAFINEYLQCWNAAQAARKAGYSEMTARSIGSENLTKPDIVEEIQRRITEMTMSADEALIRLSDHARADMSDFITIRHGLPFVDLEKASQRGKLHLLKKFRNTDKGVEIELQDVQSALVQVLKEQHLIAGTPTSIVAVLPDLVRAMEGAGLNPSDVFNNMLARLNAQAGKVN